jgi:signal transduction histidine kinase
MMQRSLAKVLEAIDSNVGWVSTLTTGGEEATLICHEGLSQEMAHRLASDQLSGCACEVAILKKVAVVIDASKAADCPVMSRKLDNGQSITCHVAVPLISKLEVVGLLYVARSGSAHFTGEDLQLLSSIGHQMGVAIENASLWGELKRREEVRGQLLKGTIAAQETERKRIARELHDQTSQSLAALMVGLNVVEGQAPEAMRRTIAVLRQLTTKTLEEVHGLALGLRPASLDDLGLIVVLQQYTKEYTSRYGIEGHFQAIGFEGRRLPPETEVVLYRIIQEALTNVVKHSEAKKVSVLLEVRGTTTVAIVEDDGKGFDVDAVLAPRASAQNLGLYGMQERAALINGALTIESTPGVGTSVFVEVPLGEEG